MYYLRTKPAAQAIQFTLDKSKALAAVQNGTKKESSFNMEALVCSLQNKEDCLACGS